MQGALVESFARAEHAIEYALHADGGSLMMRLLASSGKYCGGLTLVSGTWRCAGVLQPGAQRSTWHGPGPASS